MRPRSVSPHTLHASGVKLSNVKAGHTLEQQLSRVQAVDLS
jgi:hypothetical protein